MKSVSFLKVNTFIRFLQYYHLCKTLNLFFGKKFFVYSLEIMKQSPLTDPSLLNTFSLMTFECKNALV